MSNTPRNFHQDLAASLAAEEHPAVLAAFATCFPDALKIHRAHPENDQLGVDAWVEYPGARMVRVDLKIRKTDFGLRTGGHVDCVLEISVGDRPGWAMKSSKTDVYMFVFLDSGRAVAFGAADVRQALKVHRADWMKRFKVVRPPTDFGNGRSAVSSLAIAVPADVLQAAIQQLGMLPEPDASLADDYDPFAGAGEQQYQGRF
jgi:hypothetical protein